MADGLSKSNVGLDFWLGVRSPAAKVAAQSKYSCTVTDDYAGIVSQTKIIVVATLPEDVAPVLQQLASCGALSDDQTLVSTALGVTLEELALSLSPLNLSVVRAMPNTLCTIGKGMTVLAPSDVIDPIQIETVGTIFESLGETLVTHEALLPICTALGASSPALAFSIIDAFVQSGIGRGLDAESATKLICSVLAGAADLVIESGAHPGELQRQVTTPGGCTIAGLLTLESAGLRSAIDQAVDVTTQKAGG